MISLEHRQQTVNLIREAVAEGARVSEACQCVEIDPGTFRRWQHQGEVVPDARPQATRPAPSNRLTELERAMILAACHRPEFHSSPPSQIVPALADQGIYVASESSFYRVLHEADEQHDRGRARKRRKRAKPTAYTATGPNQCWCWDVTWLRSPVRGMYYYLYMLEDVFSRKIVGWDVYETECSELASRLVERAVRAEGYPGGLEVLHADNGAIQKSSTLRATLDRLGIEPSYSRPRTSNDNAFPEALFRTVKYRPDFPVDGFAGLEAAREWSLSFVRWYNEEHRHSALKFVTPLERHTGADIEILANRDVLYRASKEKHPERWSGKTRNWERSESVTLNPDKPAPAPAENLQEAA